MSYTITVERLADYIDAEIDKQDANVTMHTERDNHNMAVTALGRVLALKHLAAHFKIKLKGES